MATFIEGRCEALNPPIAGSGSNIHVGIPSMNPDGSFPDLSMLIAIAIILVLYFVFMFLTKSKKERVR